MTNPLHTKATDQDRTREALIELVEALDRRVPHVERSGELPIAREAARLRAQARRRIDELTHSAEGVAAAQATQADAVMTDDGGPVGGGSAP